MPVRKEKIFEAINQKLTSEVKFEIARDLIKSLTEGDDAEHHQPCPFCCTEDDPGEDRFYQMQNDGSFHCRRCNFNGDLIDLIAKYKESNQYEVAKIIVGYILHKPDVSESDIDSLIKLLGTSDKTVLPVRVNDQWEDDLWEDNPELVEQSEIAKKTKWENQVNEHNHGEMATWLSVKKSITVEAVKTANGYEGTHSCSRKTINVIAFPICNFENDEIIRTGTIIYSADGSELPAGKDKTVKIKTVQGSKSGVIGFNTSDAIKHCICNKIIKTAGVSDYLALNSQLIAAKKNQKYIVFTTSGGENENPDKFADLVGKALNKAEFYIIADNDEAGEKGAERWAQFGIKYGAVVKIIHLPKELEGKPVKDTRDYFNAGGTLDEFEKLLNDAPVSQHIIEQQWELNPDNFFPMTGKAVRWAMKLPDGGCVSYNEGDIKKKFPSEWEKMKQKTPIADSVKRLDLKTGWHSLKMLDGLPAQYYVTQTEIPVENIEPRLPTPGSDAEKRVLATLKLIVSLTNNDFDDAIRLSLFIADVFQNARGKSICDLCFNRAIGGAGKDILFGSPKKDESLFQKAFGESFHSTTPDAMSERFNNELAGTAWLWLSETEGGGTHTAITSGYKRLIGNVLTVEQKGKEKFSIPNLLKIGIASQHQTVKFDGGTDRRLLVLSPKIELDSQIVKEYFSAIKDDGWKDIAAFFKYLNAEPLKKTYRNTKAKVEMKDDAYVQEWGEIARYVSEHLLKENDGGLNIIERDSLGRLLKENDGELITDTDSIQWVQLQRRFLNRAPGNSKWSEMMKAVENDSTPGAISTTDNQQPMEKKVIFLNTTKNGKPLKGYFANLEWLLNGEKQPMASVVEGASVVTSVVDYLFIYKELIKLTTVTTDENEFMDIFENEEEIDNKKVNKDNENINIMGSLISSVVTVVGKNNESIPEEKADSDLYASYHPVIPNHILVVAEKEKANREMVFQSQSTNFYDLL